MNILATKYRPIRLLDVVGQEVAKKSIYNSIKNNKLHHAYIFYGPPGISKTTQGRIFSYLLHSGTDPDELPDMNNKITRSIFEGESIDVIEIDAASNRGIDNIRDLKSQASYSPVNGKKKIYLIDEIHQLSKDAFGALLKVIEEPPRHVVFILCTTNISSVPDAIRSRCIKFNLLSLDWREIDKHLLNICKKENINITEDACKIIAQASSGSIRNALNNLELVLAYSGTELITNEHVIKSLGVADDDSIINILEGIFNKDAPKSLLNINKIINASTEANNIINKIEYHLKNILNCKICEKNVLEFGIQDDLVKKYNFISSPVKGRSVAKVIGQLIPLKQGLEVNLDIQMLLEQWVVNSMVEIQKDQLKEVK